MNDETKFITRLRIQACFWACLAGLLNVSTGSKAALRDPWRIVAVQHQPAPGTSAAQFSTFHPPVINDIGQTAFGAQVTGVDGVRRLGIWSEGNGKLDIVALNGVEPVGVPFITTDYLDFAFNNRGDTVFYNGGIWLHRNGVTELAVGPGVPVTVDGQNTLFAGLSRPVINHHSELAFVGSDDNFFRGAYVGNNGKFHKVADNRTLIPGTPLVADTDFWAPPVINSSGQLATWGGPPFGNKLIWTNARGPVELVAQAGLSDMGEPEFRGLGYPIITSTGQVAFTARLQGNGVTNEDDHSLWMYGSSGLRMLGREGDKAPGMPHGVVFESFYDIAAPPVSDEHGNLALAVRLRGPTVDSSNNRTVWRTVGEELEPVAQSGSAAPGVEQELIFHTFEAPLLNGHGQIAFKARLRGFGAYNHTDEGIWATDRRGELQLIVREGDTVDFDPGPGLHLRTVSEIFLSSNTLQRRSLGYRSHGAGDQPYSFNSRGQIAFVADFTDGTSAILVSNAIAVPESGSLMICVLGTLCISSWSRTRSAPHRYASFSYARRAPSETRAVHAASP